MCLVSSEKEGNEGKIDHLEGSMKKTLAVFPEATAVVEPRERTLNDPTLGQHDEGVQLAAQDNLDGGIEAEQPHRLA